MDAVTEVPVSLTEQGVPKEVGLKFSGRSVPSIDHPQRNEDQIAHSATDGFAMVLDGMGGLQNGDKASLAARDQLARKLKEIPQDADPEAAKRSVSNALMEASTVVATKVPEGGTTATVVKFIESGGVKRAIIGHVGDSRAYALREGRLIQVTEDDNIIPTTGSTLPEKKAIGQKLDAVETQEDLVKLSPQERTYFDRRNQISAALGDQRLQPHIYHLILREGDKIILTSDGVHDNLSQKELEQIVKSNEPDLASVLIEQAVQRSKERGVHVRAKPDDISAVVVEVASPGQPVREQLPNIPEKIEPAANPQEATRRANEFWLAVLRFKNGPSSQPLNSTEEKDRETIRKALARGETIESIEEKARKNFVDPYDAGKTSSTPQQPAVQVGEAVKPKQPTIEQAQKSGQTAEELSPQEALELAQIMLQVAQAQKTERNMRWDDKRFQAAEEIQKRLAKGETIDDVIVKSAANLRAIRSRMGLK